MLEPTNVVDIRLSPEVSSRRDFIFFFETADGHLVVKYNGQAKTGQPGYVASRVVKMAQTPGYGKVAYVDGRYVNPDGTPRIAPDAFTAEQAEKLKAAKVRLRAIPNLEERAEALLSHLD